jgi:hypothetical protein
MSNTEYCEECDTYVSRNKDGNVEPCGWPTCPFGRDPDEGDPEELEFDE